MIEQLSIFDWHPNEGQKPYHYRFHRYVGQKVRMMIGASINATFLTGTIKRIDQYYTFVRVGRKEYAATPYNLAPIGGEAE